MLVAVVAAALSIGLVAAPTTAPGSEPAPLPFVPAAARASAAIPATAAAAARSSNPVETAPRVTRAIQQAPTVAPRGFLCRTVRRGAVTYSCVIGRSVDGRAMVADRQGNPTARRVLVVSGQMHGEEWPGPLTVDVVRRIPTSVRGGYQIWTVRTINPDGGAIARRYNSRGVNLNANFPNKFLRAAHSGSRALSEPESAAIARFLIWVQPDLVVSLHGFSEAVDTTGGGRRAAFARTFSVLSGIRPAHVVPCGGPCHGNMTDWYSATSRVHGVAFTVELPRSSRVVRRCGVPGRPARATPIVCTAWAAVYLAARLPA